MVSGRTLTCIRIITVLKKKDIDTVMITCKMRVARETFDNNLVKEQKKQLLFDNSLF